MHPSIQGMVHQNRRNRRTQVPRPAGKKQAPILIANLNALMKNLIATVVKKRAYTGYQRLVTVYIYMVGVLSYDNCDVITTIIRIKKLISPKTRSLLVLQVCYQLESFFWYVLYKTLPWHRHWRYCMFSCQCSTSMGSPHAGVTGWSIRVILCQLGTGKRLGSLIRIQI